MIGVLFPISKAINAFEKEAMLWPPRSLDRLAVDHKLDMLRTLEPSAKFVTISGDDLTTVIKHLKEGVT